MWKYLIIVLVLLGGMLKVAYDIVRLFILYYFGDFINRRLLFKSLLPRYKRYLKTFTYYQQLNPEDQRVFEKRMQKFIDKKKFVARGALKQVTPEMKALIAASAIQLTFGYPRIYFEFFWRILIYPDNYYSNITRKYHKGEVNSKGYIVLSWSNFVEGYAHGTDGINLGLHEMAHALKLENAIKNLEYDFIDWEVFKAFDKAAWEEMYRIYDGESNFFRKYAGSNREEFWAVAVENFFERPAEFQAYDAYLYRLMCEMLQQDLLSYQQKNITPGEMNIQKRMVN